MVPTQVICHGLGTPLCLSNTIPGKRLTRHDTLETSRKRVAESSGELIASIYLHVHDACVLWKRFVTRIRNVSQGAVNR